MNTSGDRKVFIQANKSQLLGARLSKYSIERISPGTPVEILQVEDIPTFQNFEGETYVQGSEERTYSLADEQSFTLSRFLPPELMDYRGRAVVIDPDVFAVQDIRPLFDTDMHGAPIACCKRNGAGFWDTSVMLLENSKLDWKIDDILARLNREEMNYNFAMRKLFDLPVTELPRIWNQLDTITDETRMIHYTRQRTQPWKTGLPYTVTPRKLGKVFGLIPREWLPSGKNKYPVVYQPHPDERARTFFFSLVRDALKDGAVEKQIIEEEIARGYIRPDLLEHI